MRTILLDVSRHEDLNEAAEVVADVEKAAKKSGVEVMLAGAFARDLHLRYRHRVEGARMTADIDFAVVVADWKSYVSLKTRLVASGAFQADSRTPHRLKHRTGLTLDLVPFGGVEGSDRTLEWPPPSETRMSAFGFREAHARAEEVALPGGVRTRIASLPGLALLKLVAWHDRHLREPKKDAQDLWLVAFNYVYCGQEDRLAAERADWFAEPEFDWQCAGSRLLGNDVRDLLDAEGRRRVDEILSKQADQNVPGDLPVEMLPRDQDRARRILKEMLRGLRDR